MSIVIYPQTTGESLPILSTQVSTTSANTLGVRSRIRLVNLRNAEFYSDGSNWKPVGGRQTLYIRQGSIASPLATLTGDGTSQQFVTPDTLVIPAGLISIHTKIYGEVFVKRGGTAQAFTVVCALGTANNVDTSADQSFMGHTISAVDGNEARLFGSAQFFSATATAGFISTGSIIPNQTTTANQTLKTTNQNTSVDMFISIGCSNTSFIAPDTMSLTGYHFWIEG